MGGSNDNRFDIEQFNFRNLLNSSFCPVFRYTRLLELKARAGRRVSSPTHPMFRASKLTANRPRHWIIRESGPPQSRGETHATQRPTAQKRTPQRTPQGRTARCPYTMYTRGDTPVGASLYNAHGPGRSFKGAIHQSRNERDGHDVVINSL